jgi:hypothetical protein
MVRKKIPTAGRPEGKEAGCAGMPPGTVYTDTLLTTTDEAVEAVAHHLRLAAMFYQSTPEDEAGAEAEVLRLIEARHDAEDPAYLAGRAFMAAIREYYEAARGRHGL